MAETAASAAPAGLPTCPPVVGIPLVPGEEICCGETEVGSAPGGKDPVAVVLRISGFCLFIYKEI